MKPTMSLGAVSLALLALTTGCAQISDTTTSIGNKLGIQNHEGAAAVGGGLMGCAGGAAIAFVAGKNALAGCAIGGVAGAAVSAFTAYQQDLDNARKTVADLQADKVNASVTEKTVTVTDKNVVGQPETKKVQAVDHVSVDLPKANFDARSPEITTIITKVGKLAAGSHTAETIDVYARTEADRQYIAKVLDTAIAGSKATYRLHPGKVARLVVTPIPDVTAAR